MKRRTKIIAALAAVAVIAGVSYYCFIQFALPHFHTVRKGMLYRSGQPKGVGLTWVKHFGIRTLINLRKPQSEGTPEEKAYAAENGLNFHNFSIGSSHDDIEAAVQSFLAIVDDDSNWPVLVHCSRGKERAGVLSAIFRIEYDRWSNEKALQESFDRGLEEDHMPIPENYIKTYKPRWNGGGGGTSQKASGSLPEVPWQD
jgi:protein tyrosine/serine phosphatase